MRPAARTLKLLAILALGTMLAGCSSSLPWSESPTVTADFANANGLYVGNTVRVLGMSVGKITDIDPRPGGVEIRMSLDDSVTLPADAQAVTITDSILTDRHIELTPVYRGGPVLAEHAVLDRGHTKTPVEFDSLLAMADKLSTSLQGDGKGSGPLADLMNLGTAATAGNGEDMRRALGALSDALRLHGDGAATKDAITQVVTNLDALTAQAARNDQELRDFGSGVHQLADLLADENFGTGDTGTQLRAILGSVTDLMQKNQGALAQLTNNSNTLTTSLADYNDNLAEFLDVFPLVTDNTYNAIDTETGALRATVDINRLLLDGQMVKEICNLLGMRNLGCATGSMRDMGPDFGLIEILGYTAGIPAK
ncbi:MCE family protein [Nocardia callitridis]|uniref:MCE family protein n=1 Tax=Nocardia callitridis TaxID=648753 RepID=A0ABP9KF25_9NOCA